MISTLIKYLKKKYMDNNDEKPEINASHIEESLIKEINPDYHKTKKRFFVIDLIRVITYFLVMQTHEGELYYLDENGGLIKNGKNIWS